MKRLLTIIILCCTIFQSHAQQYLNHQLRLEPVWARVADALGEPGSVESVEFSPDGKHVIAVGQSDHARGETYLWEWQSGKLVKKFNHTGKKIESISWHPNGQYIAHAGHDPYIYVYRLSDILGFSHDNIPVAHKVWASDNAEYIDFNADGSFLASAHQNGLIKLWVWMSEDPDLNSKRHSWVKEQQTDAQRK